LNKIAQIALAVFALLVFSSGTSHFASSGEIKTIIIDAGHGGKDPGNLGTRRYKTTEKDIALTVALKLGGYIKEHMPDVKVVYTRSTDVFIPLQERAAIANKAKGDLFISVHCDAFTKSSVNGSTSLVLGRNHDDENRVAIIENSAILLEDNYEEKYEGFDPKKPESLIALNLYQNTYFNQSVLLAKKIQDQFRTRVDRKDRGIKQQPLYVTSRTAMPAVLVELGFLTNPSEEDFLNSDKGQSYMASAIFRAVRDYKIERDQILEVQSPSAEKPTLKPIEPPQELPKVSEPKPAEEPPLSQPAAFDKTTVSSPSQEAEKSEPKEEESLVVNFGVQILTSASAKELIPANFKGLTNVKVLAQGGLYKFYVGPVPTFAAAKVLQSNMRKQGFPDSFVIGFKNGAKIGALEALKLRQ
jgi:N-acetylmuramoyl-L-alanine amidase